MSESTSTSKSGPRAAESISTAPGFRVRALPSAGEGGELLGTTQGFRVCTVLAFTFQLGLDCYFAWRNPHFSAPLNTLTADVKNVFPYLDFLGIIPALTPALRLLVRKNDGRL